MWTMAVVASAGLAFACGPSRGSTGSQSSDGTTGEGSEASSASGQTSSSTTGNAGTTAATVTSGTSSPDGSSSDGGERASSGTTAGECVNDAPVRCGNKLYSCGNGEDDDGDGLVDLEDPECIGPCDDDESVFQTGIPDPSYCEIDCFFDDNIGQGDDGCYHAVACDPLGLANELGCTEEPAPGVCDEPVEEMCVDVCLPKTPNGCDCFGCCALDFGGGEAGFVSLVAPECSLDAPEACPACTPELDCFNPCEPDACETCIGETGPAPACDRLGCVDGLPCASSCDCPGDQYCHTGCCRPAPG